MGASSLNLGSSLKLTTVIKRSRNVVTNVDCLLRQSKVMGRATEGEGDRERRGEVFTLITKAFPI